MNQVVEQFVQSQICTALPYYPTRMCNKQPVSQRAYSSALGCCADEHNEQCQNRKMSSRGSGDCAATTATTIVDKARFILIYSVIREFSRGLPGMAQSHGPLVVARSCTIYGLQQGPINVALLQTFNGEKQQKSQRGR